MRLELKLLTTQTNLSIAGKVGKWDFVWSNNTINAIRNFRSLPKDVFSELEKKDNAGLLVDILCIYSETEISTELSYRIPEQNTSGSSDEWPNRIRPGSTKNFSDEEKELLEYLLKFNKNNYLNSEIKLLNYWRRGFDLESLGYTDEAFLVFFKILEYFEKKSSSVPTKYQKPKALKKAYRMLNGSGYKTPGPIIQLVKDIVLIRNNFDIAHMRIRPLPETRDSSALYYTYYLHNWDIYEDLKELTRFLILKQIGIKKIALQTDGGLLFIRKV